MLLELAPGADVSEELNALVSLALSTGALELLAGVPHEAKMSESDRSAIDVIFFIFVSPFAGFIPLRMCIV